MDVSKVESVSMIAANFWTIVSIFGAFIASLLIWCFQLARWSATQESRIGVLERDLKKQEESQKEKNNTIFNKIEAVQTSTQEIIRILGQIEGWMRAREK